MHHARRGESASWMLDVQASRCGFPGVHQMQRRSVLARSPGRSAPMHDERRGTKS